MSRSSGTVTKAVVFDLDGTLLDTMTAVPVAYAETIRALGGPDVSPDEVVAAWHVGPTPVLLGHFLGRPAATDDVDRFYRQLEKATAAVRPFPGVTEMIGALGRAGYQLGVFTSATRRAATLTMSAAGLNGPFSAVVCGDEVAEPKPAPEGLLLACRQLGAVAAQTAYVGDAEVDVQCAEAAGSVAIHARWDPGAANSVGRCAVAYVPGDIVRLLE